MEVTAVASGRVVAVAVGATVGEVAGTGLQDSGDETEAGGGNNDQPESTMQIDGLRTKHLRPQEGEFPPSSMVPVIDARNSPPVVSAA